MPRQKQTEEERIASKEKKQLNRAIYMQKRRSDPDIRAQEQAQDTLRRRRSREKVRQTQEELETEVLTIKSLLIT
jgi:hypothetical protein